MSRLLVACAGFAVAATAVYGQAASNEEVARRQLEIGRSFLAQGKYAEALRDLRGVAEIHSTTSVADDALMEIARYFFDVAGDQAQAASAIETIIKKYSTSDSAPEAYLMSGRLAMARSHQPADIDAALADFERVIKVHPNSPAVARSLQLSGEARWYMRRFNEALADLGRVEVEYPTGAAATQAYLSASRVRVSLGDPLSAMEELQQVRNRWPASPEAAVALGRITLLHRLYMRSRSGPAFTLSTEPFGPAKLENVAGVAASRGAIYWAAETGISVAGPADAPKPPAVLKPRGLAIDATGRPVAIDGGNLRPAEGTVLPLIVPRANGTADPLAKVLSVAQLSSGDWLVADEDEKGILRFNRGGTFIGVFAPGRPSRLAINAVDEVAAIDREQKAVVLFDANGRKLTSVPLKTTTYELPNPEDLAFDVFGHLYVLDRAAVAVFSPFGDGTTPATTAAPASAVTYQLRTMFSEPDKTPGAFHRGTSFAVDPSGALFIYDDRAQKILVYR